jgi:hypothetical protein
MAEEAAGVPPSDADVRTTRGAMFGDARVALLYAGNLGRAHDAQPFLDLARATRDAGVVVAFQGIGRREREVREAARDLPNVRFLPACDVRELPLRLRAADAHLVSLRPEWSGIVVPSKFFAALSAGRPVLYAGPDDSDVARWIREHDVGMVLDHVLAGKAPLDRLLVDAGWSERCLAVARTRFSREAALSTWAEVITR